MTDSVQQAAQPVGRDQAEHYVWGGACDGWRHLSRHDLSVIHERVPPGGVEVRHLHRKARQLFFVLSGTLEIELDGAIHELGPETSLEIAPGLPHRVANHTQSDVWFLVISSPATKEDRVEVPGPGGVHSEGQECSGTQV